MGGLPVILVPLPYISVRNQFPVFFAPADAETIVDEDSELFIRENLLLLEIFYAEDGRQIIIHRPAYDFYSLLCDIGGALALLCGASILTR